MLKDESQISRQARWQRKHRAMGLCVLCSRPAFKGWRCKKHYEQHKITMRLRYIPKVRGRYKVRDTSAGEGTAKTRSKASAAKKKTSAATTRATSKKAASSRKSASTKATATRKTATRKAAAKTTSSRTRKKTTSAAKKSTSRRTTARKSAKS